jgi:LPS export ABC transporter protein LptC
MTRQLLFLLCVITLAVLAWHQGYFQPITSSIQTIDDATNDEKKLIASIVNLKRQQFDEHGQPESLVTTVLATQYNDHDYLLFAKQPSFAFGKDKQKWHGQSATAMIDTQAETSALQGNVIFYHDANNTRVHTNHLTINNNQKTAFTDDSVELQNEQNKTTAKGMSVDLQKQTIVLKQNVHSTFKLGANTRE